MRGLRAGEPLDVPYAHAVLAALSAGEEDVICTSARFAVSSAVRLRARWAETSLLPPPLDGHGPLRSVQL